MRYLILTSFALLFVNCHQDTVNKPTILSGKLPQGTTSISLYDAAGKTDISVGEDGSFLDTLDITESSYLDFSAGDIFTSLFVEAGDEIILSLDPATDELTYSGDNAATNNYLAKKATINEALMQDFGDVFPLEEEAALARLDTINALKTNLLADQELTSQFKSMEKQNLVYEHIFNVCQYANYHQYFAEGYVPTSLISDIYSGTKIDNEAHAKQYSSFRGIVSVLLEQKAEALDSSYNQMDRSLEVLKGIESPSILHTQLVNALYYLNANTENMETVRDNMLSLAKLAITKDEINARYATMSVLKPGKPSPTFDYENYAGGKTKLADLKGKYVYVDVWATWCGPCLGQIPSLKALETDYHNANVEFVSISIDNIEDHPAWQKMIENRELGGTQLFADNNWESKFIRDYGIQGIPHFILLDPEGNIVSADAARPSDPKIREEFTTLGL